MRALHKREEEEGHTILSKRLQNGEKGEGSVWKKRLPSKQKTSHLSSNNCGLERKPKKINRNIGRQLVNKSNEVNLTRPF